jgi:predicted metal-binding protein
MEQKSFETYIQTALRMKAKDAKVIPSETVVTAQWVREKCQFGCGGYGQRLTCPPHSPTPEKTRDMLSHYKYALLVHGDENTPVNRIVVKLERKIFLDGHEKAFAFGCGPCFLCEDCPQNPGSCRHPEEARPSMEASGIDVYSTVKAHGLPLEVLKNEQEKPNYYGLILIE